MTNVFSKVRTPAQTKFEKVRAREIKEMYERGTDPLTVSSHTSGGSYRYTYDDIANYMQEYNVSYHSIVNAYGLEGVANLEK